MIDGDFYFTNIELEIGGQVVESYSAEQAFIYQKHHIKEELVDFQRKYFDKSPWGNQIFQHLGEAISIIPNL